MLQKQVSVDQFLEIVENLIFCNYQLSKFTTSRENAAFFEQNSNTMPNTTKFTKKFTPNTDEKEVQVSQKNEFISSFFSHNSMIVEKMKFCYHTIM